MPSHGQLLQAQSQITWWIVIVKCIIKFTRQTSHMAGKRHDDKFDGGMDSINLLAVVATKCTCSIFDSYSGMVRMLYRHGT